jgi:NDP-sugar pyrophosphorylase family protein
MYGDSYLTVDFATVQVWNRARKFSAVMTVLKNRDQWDRSNVRIAGDHVTFYQKNAALGECDYIDYGLSLFRRGIVERYRDASLPLDLGSIQRDLVASGEMGAFEVMDRFYEIGTPVGLMSLNEHLKRRG